MKDPKPFVFFVSLLLLGFSTAVVDTSKQHYIDSQPLNEIQVTSKHKYLGPCSYLKGANPLQKYVDCMLSSMQREDI